MKYEAMEKEERKKKVVINGQEIEVPEGYEVVVEGERIRVVPKEEKKEPVKVVQAGEEVPESVVRTLRSVGLSFDEEKMRRNVALYNRMSFLIGMSFMIGVGVVFAVIGITFLMDGDTFFGFLGTFLGSLAVIEGILHLEPLFVKRNQRKN